MSPKTKQPRERRRALKRRLSFFLFNTIGYPILWVLLRVWPWTLRWRNEGIDEVHRLIKGGGPLIFAFWHSDMTGIYWHGRLHAPAHRIHIMISPSRDGRLLMRLIPLMGYRAVAGSSASRGISGLKALLDVLKKGDYVAMALDGPRGPRHVIKPGVLFLAQHAGATIIPVIHRMRRKWTLRSWDRQELPKPFSTIDVRALPPLEIPASLPHDDLVGSLRENLERRMIAAKEEAESGN